MVSILKTIDLSWFMKFNLDKINNLSESSQIRIMGYLEYFRELPIINQFIGVGFFNYLTILVTMDYIITVIPLF